MKIIPLRPAPTPGEGPTAARKPERWRAARLLTAPHRMGFFAAAVWLAASALWWAVVLATRQAGVMLPFAVPMIVAHGLLMSLSFMPLFIVGFLFTAGPKWLGLPDVPASSLLRPVLALGGGFGLALVGFHVTAPLAGFGVAVAAVGWTVLMGRFLRLLRASPAPDQLHARWVAAAGGVGSLAMLMGAVGLAWGQVPLARAAAQLALWGFLAPTVTVVSHRMLPFFTTSALPFLHAWRPNWLLAAMGGALAVTAVGATAEALVGTLGMAAHATLLAVQAPAAVLVLWLALRWGLVHSLRIRLLAMLHGGFVWLGVALALAALSHARMLWTGGAESLGLAPLHALTMGYLGATLMAMITRVAAGHSGRPLAADRLAFGLYLALQAAALSRVAAALWPGGPVALTLLAAAAWTLACVGWAWRYGAWLGQPRADGRPG